MLPFPGTDPDSGIFRYSHRFDPFPVLPGIVIRNSHGFYLFPVLARMMPFWVLTQIRPLFGTPRDSYSKLTRILPFPGTDPDFCIFRYSHIFDPFPVLPDTVSLYSHGFYHSPVLTRMMPFLGTHTDTTLFWHSPGQLFETRMDSTFSRY